MRMLADRYGISYDLRSERDLVLPASGVPKLALRQADGDRACGSFAARLRR